MTTLRSRELRLHLWNHHTGKSICGRQVDRFSLGVTTDVSSVTCKACRAEIGQLTSYIEDLAGGSRRNWLVGGLWTENPTASNPKSYFPATSVSANALL